MGRMVTNPATRKMPLFLMDKVEKQQPMTLLEKDFLEESRMEIDSGE